MKPSYTFSADWAFYRTAFARYRAQNQRRYVALGVSALLGTILLVAWLYGQRTGAFWTPIPEFALIGAVVSGSTSYAIAKALLTRRFKRSPSYGATVTVSLEDDGLHATEPLAQTTLAWGAFTRVARFPDGMLFIRGRVIRWLPDAALQNSTPEEALAFVRTKVEVTVVG